MPIAIIITTSWAVAKQQAFMAAFVVGAKWRQTVALLHKALKVGS